MKNYITRIVPYLQRYIAVLSYPEYLTIGKFRFKLKNPKLSVGMKWFLYNNTDSYEIGERNLVADVLKPGDIVLEAGTSIGILSGHISTIIGNTGKLITLEGDPKLHTIARSINEGNSNITFINGVLNFEKTGQERFTPEGWLGGRISDGENAISVDAYDLIGLCEKYNPNLLMLDIEGGEEGFLRIQIPDCIRNMIVELHSAIYGEKKQAEIEKHFAENGFTFINKFETVYSYQRTDNG